MFISFFFALKARPHVFKFEFCQLSLGKITNKFTINWAKLHTSWTPTQVWFQNTAVKRMFKLTGKDVSTCTEFVERLKLCIKNSE